MRATKEAVLLKEKKIAFGCKLFLLFPFSAHHLIMFNYWAITLLLILPGGDMDLFRGDLTLRFGLILVEKMQQYMLAWWEVHRL